MQAQLVDGLVELDRAHGVGRVGDVARPTARRCGAWPRSSGRCRHARRGLSCPGWRRAGRRGRRRPSSISGHTAGCASTSRPSGSPPSRQGLGLVGQDHGHRAVGRDVGGVGSYGQAIGGVGHMGTVEQHQGVEPVGGHLGLELGVPLPPQPPDVELQRAGDAAYSSRCSAKTSFIGRLLHAPLQRAEGGVGVVHPLVGHEVV